MPFATGGVQDIFNTWFNPGAVSVSLHTGQAVVGTSGNEITTPGYRRGSPGPSPWTYDAATGTIENANDITFGQITQQSPRITHWAILNASGTVIWRGALATAPGILAPNSRPTLRAGDIDLRIPFE